MIKWIFNSDDELSISEDVFSFYNENIYFLENIGDEKSNIKIIDLKGNVIASKETKRLYNEQEIIRNNFYIYSDNGSLYAKNIDNNDIKEIAKMDSSWTLRKYESIYYSKAMLDNLNKNGEDGIYIVIDYQSVDDNGIYGMEYCYTKDNRITEYPIKEARDYHP